MAFSSISLISSGFSLSPRGDGNSIMLAYAWTTDDFLYPREGTETAAARCPLAFWSRFSLSPRGDGNLHFPISRHAAIDFLYPREGTETASGVWPRHFGADFLYPREGTETPAFHRALRAAARFSLSPRGAAIPNKNRHFCHPSIYKQCVMC